MTNLFYQCDRLCVAELNHLNINHCGGVRRLLVECAGVGRPKTIPDKDTAWITRKLKVVRETSRSKPPTAPWTCVCCCGHRCQGGRFVILGKFKIIIRYQKGRNGTITSRELVGNGSLPRRQLTLNPTPTTTQPATMAKGKQKTTSPPTTRATRSSTTAATRAVNTADPKLTEPVVNAARPKGMYPPPYRGRYNSRTTDTC
jgi:hypothetical protein